VNDGRIRIASATDGLYLRNGGPVYGPRSSIWSMATAHTERTSGSTSWGMLLRAGEDAVGQRRSV